MSGPSYDGRKDSSRSIVTGETWSQSRAGQSQSETTYRGRSNAGRAYQPCTFHCSGSNIVIPGRFGAFRCRISGVSRRPKVRGSAIEAGRNTAGKHARSIVDNESGDFVCRRLKPHCLSLPILSPPPSLALSSWTASAAAAVERCERRPPERQQQGWLADKLDMLRRTFHGC